jgi:hypothetical protein
MAHTGQRSESLRVSDPSDVRGRDAGAGPLSAPAVAAAVSINTSIEKMAVIMRSGRREKGKPDLLCGDLQQSFGSSSQK